LSVNNRVSEKEALGDQVHARISDYMHPMPDFILKKHYESFSEGSLLKRSKPSVGKVKLFEVCCVTAEQHRYIRSNRNDIAQSDRSQYTIGERLVPKVPIMIKAG
jgi:hypothetical protein